MPKRQALQRFVKPLCCETVAITNHSLSNANVLIFINTQSAKAQFNEY